MIVRIYGPDLPPILTITISSQRSISTADGEVFALEIPGELRDRISAAGADSEQTISAAVLRLIEIGLDAINSESASWSGRNPADIVGQVEG